MYSFKLFKSKGKFKLNINSSIRIMGEIFMIMKTQFRLISAYCKVPLHACFFPVIVPFHFSSGRNEILHFHLLEFTHSEDELTCNNFISKCLAYLRNAKRKLLPRGFLHV